MPATPCTCCSAFDIATIEENRAAQQTPACDSPASSGRWILASELEQACVSAVVVIDGFNWATTRWITRHERVVRYDRDGAWADEGVRRWWRGSTG